MMPFQSSDNVGSKDGVFKENESKEEIRKNSGDICRVGSVTTLATDDIGSISEDESGGWLGGITTDFRNLAACFKDNVPPVIGGVASMVHKTAIAVAAEIAELEHDSDADASRFSGSRQGDAPSTGESLYLPWELKKVDPATGIEDFESDDELKTLILALSLTEKSFREPHSSGDTQSESFVESGFFLDEARITLIRRLLDIDENLAAMHAKLSGRSNTRETVFWRNYFHHCDQCQKQFNEASATPPDVSEQFQPTATETSQSATVENNMMDSTSSLDDSLVAASSDDENEDDASYVIPSAPTSCNTFATTRSVDDLVLVGHDGQYP